jgi:AraC family transcriptional regulator, transcriptional activator of pobA
MKGKETTDTFHHPSVQDDSIHGQFTIYRIEDYCVNSSLPDTRKDFYKITLLKKGEGILSFPEKSFHIKNGMIVFFNPKIPYSWEPVTMNDSGFSCLFTEDFIHHPIKTKSLLQTPLFQAGGYHVLVPDKKSISLLTGIFEQMMVEMQSPYPHKLELLRSYIQIIIHEALKIAPLEAHRPGNSTARIKTLFMELLENQFPIVSLQHTLRYKNAHEYAFQLAIHTNHLNRALKEITGHTTTELISSRIIKEAKALLMHSDWDIAEIGFCLGFDHASNFNIFFKKQTGFTPRHYRRQALVLSRTIV